MNHIDSDDWIKSNTHPCRLIYVNLVKTVQGHIKCSSDYCFNVDSHANQYFRFHYPFKQQKNDNLFMKKVQERRKE